MIIKFSTSTLTQIKAIVTISQPMVPCVDSSQGLILQIKATKLLCHNQYDKCLSPRVDGSQRLDSPVAPKQCQPVLLNRGTDVLLPVEVTLFPSRAKVKVVQDQHDHRLPDRTEEETLFNNTTLQ